MSFAIASIILLLKNFALEKAKINCILLIIFFASWSNSLDVIYLKSLYSKSVTTTMAMLFYISLFGVITTLSYLMSIQISKNTLMTALLNSFNWLIFEYVSNYWDIKYAIFILILEYMALCFFYICCGLSLVIMLLNKLLLTFLNMIFMTMSIAI